MNWKIKYGPVLIIIAIIGLIIEAGEIIGLIKSPIKIETIEQAKSLKKGDHVTLDVKMVSDALMSETKTMKKGAVSKTYESYYYVIPFLDSEKDDKWLVTIKLGQEDFGKANDGMIAYINYYETKKMPTEVIFTVDGLVEEMTDEEKKYIPSQYESLMDKIYILDRKKNKTFVIPIVLFVMLIVGTVLVALYFKDKKKEKAKLQGVENNNQEVETNHHKIEINHQEMETNNSNNDQASQTNVSNNDQPPQINNLYDYQPPQPNNPYSYQPPQPNNFYNYQPTQPNYQPTQPINLYNYQSPQPNNFYNYQPYQSNSPNNYQPPQNN